MSAAAAAVADLDAVAGPRQAGRIREGDWISQGGERYMPVTMAGAYAEGDQAVTALWLGDGGCLLTCSPDDYVWVLRPAAEQSAIEALTDALLAECAGPGRDGECR